MYKKEPPEGKPKWEKKQHPYFRNEKWQWSCRSCFSRTNTIVIFWKDPILWHSLLPWMRHPHSSASLSTPSRLPIVELAVNSISVSELALATIRRQEIWSPSVIPLKSSLLYSKSRSLHYFSLKTILINLVAPLVFTDKCSAWSNFPSSWKRFNKITLDSPLTTLEVIVGLTTFFCPSSSTSHFRRV